MIYPLVTHSENITLVRENFVGSGTSFTLSTTPSDLNSVRVFSQGILKRYANPVGEYSLSGPTITFLVPRTSDTRITVFYTTNVSSTPTNIFYVHHQLQQVDDILELDYLPHSNLEEVYVQGVLRTPGLDYQLIGKQIQFNNTLPINTLVTIKYHTIWS